MQLVDGTWAGDDVELGEVEDFDGLLDLLRERGEDPSSVVLFVEEDDEYVFIVRLNGEREPLTFISDRRMLGGGWVAARVLSDELSGGEEEPDEEESVRPEVEPAGDPGLLDDLGVSAERLLGLCAGEGMLPSDVIFEVCEAIGCGPVLEELRGV
jgi:putative tRNA adenosine deaminase-associated protein